MQQFDSKDLVAMFNRFHKLKLFDKITSLTKSEFMILDKIMKAKVDDGEKPKVTISNMAKYLSTTVPGASRMLSFIENKGYIQRISDKEDKRITYVTLTEEGEQLINQAYKTFNEFMETVFNQVGEEDLNEFIRLFAKMNQIIEEELKKRG